MDLWVQQGTLVLRVSKVQLVMLELQVILVVQDAQGPQDLMDFKDNKEVQVHQDLLVKPDNQGLMATRDLKEIWVYQDHRDHLETLVLRDP